MEQNFFTFAGDCSTEYTFLCWCLFWYNDKSERNHQLFCMAKDLLALMGEDKLPDNQKIDICQWSNDGIDILINLRGLNRVLVIDHRIGSMQYEDEILEYRKELLQNRNKKFLAIDECVAIRTVLFHTYYCMDFYHHTTADCKICKESFLSVLEKYETVNESLDIYIDSLRERIALDEEDREYKKVMRYADYLDFHLSHSRIAQYKFMTDIFRSYYPDSIRICKTDEYRIEQGDDSGGEYPWTDFPFIEGIVFHGSEVVYYLSWCLETYERTPYISLRLFESHIYEDAVLFEKVDKAMNQLSERFIIQHPELKFNRKKVKSSFADADIFGHHMSTILSVSLKQPLEHWETEADTLRHSLLSITNYFLEEAPKIMLNGGLLDS